MENLAVSLAPDAGRLQHLAWPRSALTLAGVIGLAFTANYANHASLVCAMAREFDFNRTPAGLFATAIVACAAVSFLDPDEP